MKTLLPLLLLATSLSALADGSAPARIRFENREYQLHRLGRTLIVSPVKVEMSASISGGRAPDCATFEGRLAKLKDAMESCGTESSSYCNLVAKNIYLMAENRSGTDKDEDFSKEKANTWQVEMRPAIVDRAGLIAAAARAGAVADSAVRLNLEPRALLKAAPSPRFGSDSLVRRVEKAAKFPASSLGTWNNRGLVTRNAFVACDLLAGRVHYTGEAESSVSSTDLTPDVVIDTAWRAYEAVANAPALDSRLSPLTQAHKVGFYLGRTMPELAEPADPLLEVTEVFNRFFEQRSFGLKLKEFSSKESMRTQIYPDQTYRVTAQHEWSL